MNIHIGRRKLRVRHILHETNDERKKEREHFRKIQRENRTYDSSINDRSFPGIVIYICNSRKLTGVPIVQYSERSKLNGFLSFAEIMCNLLELDKIFLER